MSISSDFLFFFPHSVAR